MLRYCYGDDIAEIYLPCILNPVKVSTTGNTSAKNIEPFGLHGGEAGNRGCIGISQKRALEPRNA